MQPAVRFKIEHEIKGRIRLSFVWKRFTVEQADALENYLLLIHGVTQVKVYERTADAAISYCPSQISRNDLLKKVKEFSFSNIAKGSETMPKIQTGRALNRYYKEKLTSKFLLHWGCRLFLPAPLRFAKAILQSLHFFKEGLSCLMKGKLEVPVLDAAAIGVSLIRQDIATAGSVMFLLQIGELLEEWTHKKSVDDLAKSMCLNVDDVWLCKDGTEISVPITSIKEGDLICVHAGGMIPMDGLVKQGEAMVNQASLTGESVPVHKEAGSYVYAGTVIEEGQLCFEVKQVSGDSRYDKIITMIEESEKIKSSIESKAEHLADRLVPFSFLGTLVTYLLTRNITKAISILMVDFSCALKLAMPLSVLSAMRECSFHKIAVKGGKFLEAAAQAQTLVFDKTGTLTKSQPTVAEIVTFNGYQRDDMLRLAACLEEHFPHSMANAVVMQANREGLSHEEMHSQVEYVVAHGISSRVADDKVVIGSQHFVFEDEGVIIPEGEEEKFASIPSQYSHLHLAISGRLAAVICIEDPLREEASKVIAQLKKSGFDKIVMMTGDNAKTAKAVAEKVGVDEFYSEVLPEDKAEFIRKEKAQGRTVLMVGDGINDSPALSEADVGVSISEGAQLAQMISDITLSGDNLYELVTLKEISKLLMKRIHSSYRFVIGFNLSLILLGAAGVLSPAMSALLHNSSTLALGLKNMTNLLDPSAENK